MSLPEWLYSACWKAWAESKSGSHTMQYCICTAEASTMMQSDDTLFTWNLFMLKSMTDSGYKWQYILSLPKGIVNPLIPELKETE